MPQNLEELIAQLGTKGGPRAASQIVTFGEGALKPLMGCLQSPSPQSRSQAAWALGELGLAGAIDALEKVLLEDPDTDVRWYAEGALDKLKGTPGARKKSSLYFRERRNIEQEKTEKRVEPEEIPEEAWQSVPEDLREVLQSDDTIARANALRKIYQESPDHPVVRKVVKDLTVALGAEEGKSRSWAAVALGMMGEGAIPALSEAIEHEDPGTRMYAAWALGLTQQPEAVLPLLGGMVDPVMEVRAASAVALGDLADPRAVNRMIFALDDEHWLVREAAARALGLAKDSRAIPGIKKATEDPDERVRKAAFEALAKIQEQGIDENSRIDKARTA